MALTSLLLLSGFVSVLMAHGEKVKSPFEEPIQLKEKRSVSSQELSDLITTSDAVSYDEIHPYRQRKKLDHDNSKELANDSSNIPSINSESNNIEAECDVSRLHQSCSGPFDDCGCTSDAIECSLTQGICVRTPRDYGEPCSIFNPCGDYSVDNPSMALRCSLSCGICVAENEGNIEEEVLAVLEQYETSSYYQDKNRFYNAVDPATFDAPCLGGLESSSFFRTWARTELTSHPIVRPTNDEELRSILLAASDNGCKVRPVGTTHSPAGVVATAKDTNIVVVSLVDYIPDDNNEEGWDKVTIIEDVDPGGTDNRLARVRVPGGYTQLQLYSVIRPLGYFLPTQSAGWLFTMGGIVSNNVQGGHFEKSYVHSYVTALRVMLADGTVQILDQEDDLRMWRSGFGLLGVITAVEFEIEKRDTEDEYYWMGFESQVLPDGDEWNKNWFDEYINRFKQEYTSAQFFFDPVTKEMSALVQKYKSRTKIDLETSPIKDSDCVWNYGRAQCECNEACKEAGRTCSYQYKFGDLTLSQSCRLDAISFIPTTNDDCMFDYSTSQCRFNKYCSYQFEPGDLILEDSCRLINPPPPDVDTMHSSYQDLLNENPFLGLTGAAIGNYDSQQALSCLASQLRQDSLMRQLVISSVRNFAKDIYATTNDGFMIREGTPLPSPFFGYMISTEHLFDVLVQISSLDFILSVPIEFRFINLVDSAVLVPGDIRQGEFVYLDCVSLDIPGYTNQAWRKQFLDIEVILKNVGGVPHTGKYFGMGRDEKDGVIKPFQNISSEDIFTARQKNEFETYRKQVDPNDLFYAGFMADYLQS